MRTKSLRLTLFSMVAAVTVAAAIAIPTVSAAQSRHSTDAARPANKLTTWRTTIVLWQYWSNQCECWIYSAIYDTASAVAFNNTNTTALKATAPVTPKTVSGAITSVAVDTFAKSDVVKGINVYALSKDLKTAKWVKGVPAPAGVNGVSVSPQEINSTSASQTVTFTRNGAAVGNSLTLPITDSVDVAVKSKNSGCADGSVSPPEEVVPTVSSLGSTGLSSAAGYPILRPCGLSYSHTIKVS